MEQEYMSREEQIRTRAYYLWEQARDEIEKEAPPTESGPVAGKRDPAGT